MSFKKITLSVATCAAAASLCAASHAFAQGRPSGLVYLETNNSAADQNAILAFQRGASGQLTPLQGAGYPTGGAGVVDLTYGLAVFANDTPVIANREHTLLFAVNEGSDTVAVFRIAPDGSLTPVKGSPFPSGGFQPVSLSLLGNILTVVNKNGDAAQATAEANAQPNYTTFTVTRDGALQARADSTITLTATASPSQALGVPQSDYRDFRALGYDTNRNNIGYVFGADFGSGNLESLVLGQNGVLKQNTPLPLPAGLFTGKTFLGAPAPALPLGLQLHPRFPILYVGLVTINQIGVYIFGPDGKLQFVDAVDNPAPTNCWIITNKAGTRMYVADTLTNQITTYDIGSNPLVPVSVGATQLQGTGRVFELALSDDGQYLYAISQQGEATGSANDNALHVLQLSSDGNSLTEIQTGLLPQFVANTPTGTRWQGVVAF
jgi:hypothetical protein